MEQWPWPPQVVSERVGSQANKKMRIHMAEDSCSNNDGNGNNDGPGEPTSVQHTTSSGAWTMVPPASSAAPQQPQDEEYPVDPAASPSESTQPLQVAAELPSQSDLLIGAGMYDITGPAAEVGMFGYAKYGQLTAGIHMRLRARAFVFHHRPTSSRCVFVSADLGLISEWVRQSVVEQLNEDERVPRGIYTLENVMISAIHTHCAPGGLSHYCMYSMHPPLRGWDRQNFECVVHGIVEAIVRAHCNQQQAFIRVAQGECLGASVNRSEGAYLANPKEERAKYAHNTDKQMVLWRFDGVNGFPIGMINWFAVHPTSMGSWYKLITGDNKGYCSHIFEKEQGTRHLMDRPRAFVAAFAQSNEGDVSPNICGPRCDETQHKDFERMVLVVNAQLDTARKLYKQALKSSPVTGAVRFAHQYVDFGCIELSERWHEYKDCLPRTSSGCIGISMMSGTHFDGRGVDAIPEGVKWGAYPKFTSLPELQSHQKEKLIVFPTARYKLSPTILPLQVFSIGSLSLAAIPFEATTMAGRRIRANLWKTLQTFVSDPVEPVIAGLSNAYCGYLTTREEYAVQRYEGASTHFGPNQLSAVCQQLEQLALSISKGTRAPTKDPPAISGFGAMDFNTPVFHDGCSSNYSFGSVVEGRDVLKDYRRGATVSVCFHAAHPKNNLLTQGTFLEVHRWLADPTDKRNGVWVIHADDGDENTFFHWRRIGTVASIVTIEWNIPEDAPLGTYRIKVNGHSKKLLASSVVPYSGVSSSFEVVG